MQNLIAKYHEVNAEMNKAVKRGAKNTNTLFDAALLLEATTAPKTEAVLAASYVALKRNEQAVAAFIIGIALDGIRTKRLGVKKSLSRGAVMSVLAAMSLKYLDKAF